MIVRLLLTLLAASGAACPSACVCDAEGLEAACEGAALEAVPTPLSGQLRRLSLADNLVSSLGAAAAPLRNLRVLDVSRNRLLRLQRGLPASLTHLYAARNSVASVDADAFQGLWRLRVLDLSHNLLLALPAPAALRPLHSLLELRLAGNLLEAVEASALAALGRLTELRLQGNALRSVALASGTLSKLDLADNNLSTVPVLALPALRALDLSGNAQLQGLGAGALRGLPQLRALRLCRLPALTGLHERALRGLARLQSLQLERCPRLRWLPPRLLDDAPDLAELSLRHCGLRTLQLLQPPAPALHTLRLAGNPLSCNCSLRWLRRPAPDLLLVDEDHVRCAAPEDVALRDADDALFNCGETWGAVAVVAASVGALFAATCGLLLLIGGDWLCLTLVRYSTLTQHD